MREGRDDMYYYFAECKDDLINILREASEDEVKQVRTLGKPITDFIVDNKRIDAFSSTYIDFVNSVTDNKSDKSHDVANKIQQKFSQLLFEFKKYCDNWQTKLARVYGQKSEEYKIFKNATAYEYDNCMEYRIMYRLRNYDQHCDTIFSKLHTTIQADGSYVIIPLADRDYLINNFSKWKPEEKDFLEKQDAFIDFTPYARVLGECIKRVHNKIMEIHCGKNFYASCAKLICIANQFADEDNVVIIATENALSEEFKIKKELKLDITTLFVPFSKMMLKADIASKRDKDKILILYYGKRYRNQLKEVGTEILSNDVMMKLAKSKSIDLCGHKMIRTNMQLKMDTQDCYFVLADRKVGYEKIKEICGLYQLYLKALLKQ